MDPNYLAQLSIRRSPRAALESQNARHLLQYERDCSNDIDHDDDGAAPPPIPRGVPVAAEKAKTYNPRAAPSPQFNPLRAHPVTPGTAATTPNRHRFSHPFRELLAAAQEPAPEPRPVTPEYEQAPRRHPSGLRSYKNPRRPPFLRKRTSLETIDSVRSIASVTPSEDQQDPLESEAQLSNLSALDYQDDVFRLPVPMDASSISSSSLDSGRSSSPSFTPKDSDESEQQRSPKALLRRIKFSKTYTNEPAVSPPITIQRKISFDRISCPSSSSNLTINVPFGQPSIVSSDHQFPRTQSNSSSEWSASSFDISGLTEAELKKCHKKGINPSLYAEMKAARKGKWASPIAGNTFLS